MSQRQASPIEPSAFTPLDGNDSGPGRQRNPVRWVMLAAGLAFALVLGFLFTARSVQIVVIADSSAEVSVSGMALPFGERYLLPRGDYVVHATAQGYHPLATSISVGDQDNQVVELALRPLPGVLTIDSDPPGATVLIDDDIVGATPIAGLQVEAGEHALRLQAERHLPMEQVLLVTGRSIPQLMKLALAPAWAEVSIATLPAGATLLVDGEAMGSTPAVLEILHGVRQLIAQHPGYADWQQDLEVVAGEAQDLGQVNLEPAAGILQLASQPSGANVTVNGEFQGQTPLALELTPDRPHRISVFKPGYRRHSRSVELPAAGTDSRTVSLQAQLGQVRFEISPANAVLRVDGRVRGNGSQTLSLPAFEHRVEVALEGHATVRRRVTPRFGLEQLVEVTLQTEQAARMSRIKPEVTTALGQTLLLFDPAAAGLADFTMGASRREPGRRANEVLHPVALRRMFYLQTTEVTNAQFRLFLAAHNSGQIEGQSLNREHQPVVQVSWQQAASFANWLSQREGLPLFYRETNGIISGYNPSATGYRLPSESEWAWAARANGETLLKFPWGESFPPTSAVENYADNTSAYVTGRVLNNYRDGHVASAPVASFDANQRGLHDLGGNVAEWVHDVYSIPNANGPTEVDPLGPQTGDNFVIRGASWTHSKIAELRLSYRDYGQAGRDDVGFRLARYAE